MVVDFNPKIIEELIEKKISCIYGDVANDEVLDRIKFGNIKVVISTIPDEEDNIFLISYVKKKNKNAFVFVTAEHVHQALDLYKHGADYVMLPHFLTGENITHT
jgi:voltage-gated potassium channel Kch